MKVIGVVIAAVAVAACTPAATPAAAKCNATLLAVTEWSIAPVDADTNTLTTTFRWTGKKPIRMIDASATFYDALGGRIASFGINRDQTAQPDGTFTQSDLWGLNTFERLLTLRPDEVSVKTCVRSVLFDDGTKEEFE